MQMGVRRQGYRRATANGEHHQMVYCCLYFGFAGERKLSLDDKLSAYFDSSLWTGLHIYHGQEYSSKLTITNLLFQTSGLPDAFEEGKHSLKKQLIREDMQVSFDEMIEWTKQLEPHFAPGTAGKAYYADINFDMLGKIIETVTDCPLAEVFKTFIFDPLGLEKTYLPSGDDFIPAVYYKEVALSRPNFIKSCAASGGAISTARELMVFLKASIDGRLFHKDVFEQLKKWNKLQLAMYPIQYGGGLMCIPLGGRGTFLWEKESWLDTADQRVHSLFIILKRTYFSWEMLTKWQNQLAYG